MADEKTGTGAPDSNQAPDPITNIKGEMNRKFGNLESQMAEMKKSNDALAAAIKNRDAAASVNQPAASAKDSDIDTEWFENPAAARTKLKEELRTEMRQENDENSRRQGTIAELVGQFPELSNGEHEFTKRAVEIYNSMSDSEKRSPISYKAAVNQAALEKGVIPKSKRQDPEESDDFTLSGNGSSGVRQTERARNRGSKIDQATVDFGRLVGLDMDDEKVKERIKTSHGRRSYGKYE